MCNVNMICGVLCMKNDHNIVCNVNMICGVLCMKNDHNIVSLAL